MSLRIDAGLDGNAPYLRILEADSGRVRMCWHGAEEAVDPDSGALDSERALQDLFRELMLLSVRDRLREGR